MSSSYDYAQYTTTQLEKELGTSIAHGLTNEQVREYQQKYGPNEIEGKGTSAYALFMRQFKSPFIYLLLGASCLSFTVGDSLNGSIILLIVIINGLLSFYQEYRAEQALKLLKAHLVMKAKVIRNSQEIVIANTELVPGDLLKLQPGDYIPADVRFVDGSLFVDESVLTGESAPIKKISTPLTTSAKDVYQSLNLGLMGTTVTGGNALALVLKTGQSTIFGGISTLSLQTIRESSFQQALSRLSSFILALICITLAGLFLFHLILHGNQNSVQLILFCIAIALGITPEGLPTVTTFALSRGALQLAHHDVIVKRLAAIEDLGAITILCTDKTGTLTENKLTVSALSPNADENMLLYALLASKQTEPLDPFDSALWEYASAKTKDVHVQYQRVHEVPFDPVKRRNSVVVAKQTEYLLIVRGAYEAIAPLCSDIKGNESDFIQEQSHKGNRILAVAYKKVGSADEAVKEHDLRFAGLIAFQDPIKKTAVAAITKAQNLGITLKMITGDSKEIACMVAQAVGLAHSDACAITGAEFAAYSDQEKLQAVHTYSVFARIVPEQKYEIITLLKEKLDASDKTPVVGYLGEGINDAPALKAAHVGLAVKGASDIAQDAADIILLQKSLRVIIEGIALGREVFSNTIKYVIAVLSSTFGNFYSLAIASLVLDFLPMLPLQVLLVNLLSDFPMVAIATDTVDPDELQKPQEFNLKGIGFFALILGLVCPIFDFMFFALFIPYGPQAVQTNWFIQSILMELALIYSVRTRRAFYKGSRPSFLLMSLSLIVGIITIILPFTTLGQEVFQFQPSDGGKLALIAAIVVAYFITTDIIKLLYLHFAGNGSISHKKTTKFHSTH